jgi:hypothetical protein
MEDFYFNYVKKWNSAWIEAVKSDLYDFMVLEKML